MRLRPLAPCISVPSACQPVILTFPLERSVPRAFGSSHFSDRSLLLLNGSSNRRSTVIRMHHRITSQELQQSLGGGSVYDGACGIRWIAMVYACCILVSWFDARDLVTARQISCTISLVFQVFLREYSSGTYRRLFQFGNVSFYLEEWLCLCLCAFILHQNRWRKH